MHKFRSKYVSGDTVTNAEILKTYKYVPSVQGGYDAILNVNNDLHNVGILKAEIDVDAILARSFKFFDDEPNSYTLNGDSFEPVIDKKIGNEVLEFIDCCN